jgi:hypothetical protein
MGVVFSSVDVLFYYAKVTIFFASFLASITVSAAFFASACVLSSTYRSNISSSGSSASSWIASVVGYRVFLLPGVAETSFCWGAAFAVGRSLSSNVCKNRTHLEVPLMSSIFFTRFLVCSI